MALLSHSALKRIESKYSDGITSAAVVKIFQERGERFSEATLRKYVQLGLLPTSRRVGIRGRHRGSSGLYPAVTVRLANEVKQALAEGHTLKAVRAGTIGLSGEVQLLRRAATQLGGRLAQAVAGRPRGAGRTQRARTLARLQRDLEARIREIEAFVAALKASPDS